MILNKNLAKVLFFIFTVAPVSFQNIYATSSLTDINAEQPLAGLSLPENILTDLNQQGIQTLGQLFEFFKTHAKSITTNHKLKGQIVDLFDQVLLEKHQQSVDKSLLKKVGDKYLNYLTLRVSPHFNPDQQSSYIELMAKYQDVKNQFRPKGADVFDRHFQALKVFLLSHAKLNLDEHNEWSQDFILEEVSKATITNQIDPFGSIGQLNLAVRATYALMRGGFRESGIFTIPQLCACTEADLLEIRHIGQNHVNSIKAALQNHGLKLRDKSTPIIESGSDFSITDDQAKELKAED
jgi:hypothetical protein